MSENAKNPTLKEKIKMYEDFLHKINLLILCGNDTAIKSLLRNADKWSYAHRMGDGELSEKEMQKNINRCFWRLLDIPNTAIHRSNEQ
jgi:hypothetical protein